MAEPPPDNPRDPAPPTGIQRIGRPALILAGAAVTAALFGALYQATSAQNAPPVPEPVQLPSHYTLPKALTSLPASYADPALQPRPERPAPPPPLPAPQVDESLRRQAMELERRTQELEDRLRRADRRIEELMSQPPPAPVAPRRTVPDEEPPVDHEREARLAAARAAAQEAANSDIFFTNAAPGNRRADGNQLADDAAPPRPAGTATQSGQPPASPRAPVEVAELKPSPSPYLLSAGSIIPVSLVTAVNSDLKGLVVAQVRESIYDTPTGRHLLIPQGARLIGRFQEQPQFGDDRVGVNFERLIRPDGSSLRLADSAASDATGASGLSDEVDNHYGAVIGGALLSAALNVGVRSSVGNPRGTYPTVGQDAAAAAGSGVGQVGNAFTERAVARPPTVTVGPGFSFNILVGQDLILPPWRPQ